MNRICLLFFISSLVLSSCQSDANYNNSNTFDATTNTIPAIVQLTCETLIEDELNPKAAIYALVQENKVKIGEIITNDCRIIKENEYAQYKIPVNALAAIGGSGDYYYILETENEYVVMKGSLGEMMEGDVEYLRVAGLRK